MIYQDSLTDGWQNWIYASGLGFSFRNPISTRIVMERFVVDHEHIARTFPEATGKFEHFATYEIVDGKIINAWFLTGSKTLDAP